MPVGVHNFTVLLEQSKNQPCPLTATRRAQNKVKYDVFISYCHKDGAKAATILEIFEQAHPEWKIFFDRVELKTGRMTLDLVNGPLRVVISLEL